ncbi:MAG: hypothetical protein K0U12_05185, partial [Gammaproteobacteria bacterium]|nr:hypothetical protein [Gammaproteobacteria bacterium]
LDVGRKFSMAIEGLVNKSTHSSDAMRVFRVNELIRNIAESNDIDVVIIDLSPSANDLNSVLLMISDFVYSTLTPEPYNDHAVTSMTEIVKTWAANFQSAYDFDQEERGGLRAISSAPKSIGFMLQRVFKKSGDFSGAAKEILGEIVQLFRAELAGALKDAGMYPEYGIYGVDKSTFELDPKKIGTVSRFTDPEERSVMTGAPIVWDARFSRQERDFNRILSHAMAHAFVHDARVPERLKEIFRKISKEHEEVEEDFEQKWSNEFGKRLRKLSYKDRVKLIAKSYYKIDVLDMLLFVRNIRAHFLQQASSGDKYTINDYGVFIADPCFVYEDNLASFGTQLLREMDGLYQTSNMESGQVFRYFIIPILHENQWYCLRVEIDHDKNQLSILFDDPSGRPQAEGSAKGSRLKDAIGKKFSNTILKATVLAAKKYVGSLQGNRHWSRQHFASTAFLFKRLDQQGCEPGGCQFNDTDSGVVVIANMEEYIGYGKGDKKHFRRTVDGRIQLRSNREYESVAKVYELKSQIKRLADDLRMDVVVEKAAGSSAASVPLLYTHVAGFSADSKSKPAKTEVSSPSVMQYRAKLARLYGDLEEQFGEIIKSSQWMASNAAARKSYVDNANLSLSRILQNYIKDCVAYFINRDPYMVSHLISLAIYRTYTGAKKRKTLLPKDQPFRDDVLKEVLRLLEVLNSKRHRSSDAHEYKDHALGWQPVFENFLVLFTGVEKNYRQNLYGLEPYQSSPNVITDSLFEAVAILLADGRKAGQLRDAVCNMIGRDLVTRADLEKHQPGVIIDDYASNMRKTTTSASAFELRVLAGLLKRPIVVLGINKKGHRIFGDAHSAEPIFLQLQAENYYAPLFVPQGKDAQAILAEVIVDASINDMDAVKYQSHRQHYGLQINRKLYIAGNCLFEAVARGVGEVTERQVKVKSKALRQLAVDQIVGNNDLCDRIEAGVNIERLRLNSGSEHYTDLQDYITKMSRDMTWGTHIELVALSHALQRPIALVTPGNTYDHIYGDEYDDTQAIFLTYNGNNHYDALIPNDDAARSVAIAQIRQHQDTMQARRTLAIKRRKKASSVPPVSTSASGSANNKRTVSQAGLEVSSPVTRSQSRSPVLRLGILSQQPPAASQSDDKEVSGMSAGNR